MFLVMSYWLFSVDYCGSFIQYCPSEQVYIVSRAVGKEVMIFDRTIGDTFQVYFSQ